MTCKYSKGILLGLLAFSFGCGAGTKTASQDTPTQPADWTIVSTVPSSGDKVAKTQIYNKMAYVAYLNGVKIVDVTDIYRPGIIGKINTPHTAATLNIAVTDNIACVAEGPIMDGWVSISLGAGALRFYNISNPREPVVLSYLDFGAEDIIADGNKIYASTIDLGQLSGASLRIIDISDPLHPTIIGSTPIDASGRLAKSGNILYISYGDIIHYKNIQAIDVSNPSAPLPIKVNGDGWGNVWNASLALWGNVAFIPDGTYGIHVVDLSNPVIPSTVRTIPALLPSNNASASNGYLYVAYGTAGVAVFDLDNPLDPKLLRTINTDLPAIYVDVQDDIGIVVTQDQSINCFRVSN